jgi:hypothetical protein
MEKINKNMMYSSLIVIGIVFLFLVVPYIFMGPPGPLVAIRNVDNVSHDASISIYNEKNKIIFNENYVLEPDTEVRESKSIMFLIIKSFPSNELYSVEVTLDNNTSEIYPTPLTRWETVEVKIDDTLSIYSSVV